MPQPMHRMQRKQPTVVDEYEANRRADEAKERLDEARASKELGNYCVGMVVEASEEVGKVRIKLLCLPGYCGPELNIDRSLAELLQQQLSAYLTTGQRQES